MSLKTIKFDLDLYRTINPSSVQDAGVQGDHRVTELEFNISSDLWGWLQKKKGDYGRLIYRVDGIDGSRGVHRSDVFDLENRIVKYPLENYLTRYGGLVEAQVVISLLIENANGVEVAENELCSFTAKLRLAFSNFTNNDNDAEFHSLSSLAAVAKTNAQIAETKAKEATDALNKTLAAKAALESGETVYIFDGGDVSGEIDVEFVVDDQMSDSSENPVSNKAVKKYVDNDTHPVGSIWVGGKTVEGTHIDPKNVFGGKWQLVDKKFEFDHLWTEDKEKIKEFIIPTIDEYGDVKSYGAYPVDVIKVGRYYDGHLIHATVVAIAKEDFSIPVTLEGERGRELFSLTHEGWKIGSDGERPALLPSYGFAVCDNHQKIIPVEVFTYDGSASAISVRALSMTSYTADNVIKKGDVLKVSFDMMLDSGIMPNEACDKFYWKRVK